MFPVVSPVASDEDQETLWPVMRLETTVFSTKLQLWKLGRGSVHRLNFCDVAIRGLTPTARTYTEQSPIATKLSVWPCIIDIIHDSRETVERLNPRLVIFDFYAV